MRRASNTQSLDSVAAGAHEGAVLRLDDRTDHHAVEQGRAAPEAEGLIDGFGRRFAYVRLSVTDRCNFRCAYCLPHGYQKPATPPQELSVAEISRFLRAFAALGVAKVRLTGGEPAVRNDLAAIVEAVTAAGIAERALTTNGYRLKHDAGRLAAAGLQSVNVSVDSLDSRLFHKITGMDRLTDILAGIDAARAAGLRVKINAVLMRGLNDQPLDQWMDFAAAKDLTVRFIETMQTGDNSSFFARRHRSGAALADALMARGWAEQPRGRTDGPARTFAPPAGQPGRIGLILPYATDFCGSCNRLRLSSAGRLHLCLFGEGGHDLRDVAQHDDQQAALIQRIRTILPLKSAGHRLAAGDFGATRHFASIGG